MFPLLWFHQIVDRDSGCGFSFNIVDRDSAGIYKKAGVERGGVLVSEAVGGRSQATELPC